MFLFDRDQFYDKHQTDTTPGEYNPTPVPQRRFSRRNQSDDFRFTFGTSQITQVGGYPLLEKEFERHQLRRRLQRRLRMGRECHGFTSPEISTWQIALKFLGCRRFHHADKYRFDPLLEKFFGIKGLPSDSTISRYNKSFTEQENEKLDRFNRQLTNQLFSDARKQLVWHPQSGEANPFKQEDEKKPMEVTLDIDGTELTVYGKQENARRGRSFRYKDSPQYRLLSSFVAGLGLWVDWKLMSGNHSLRGHGQEMVTRAEGKLPEYVTVTGLRGDNALYSGDDIKRWIEEGKTIGITASCQDNLMKEIGAVGEEEWQSFHDQEGDFVCEIAEITFCPSSWDHGPYRYIISRTEREKPKKTAQKKLFDLDAEYDYYPYITNHEGNLREAYQFVVGRCDVENGIKETKVGFDGKDVPHDSFEGNRSYLGHVQAAYNLKISISLNRLPASANRHQREMLARKLIHIPARLIKQKRGWVISLAEWWPYKKLARQVLTNTGPPPDG